MALTPERIREIERVTIGQSANPIWLQYRQNRLTASVFAGALTGLQEIESTGWNRTLYAIRRSMFNHINKTCEATKWGIDHESHAIKEYERQTGKRVIESGIWLFPEGDLAATPDGLVLDPSNPSSFIGIVEIKCLFKCRDARIRSDREWSHLVSYLDTECRLKPSCNHYHQIQGQLSATNLPWCDFVLWCPTRILVQRIEPDEAWRARSLPAIHYLYRNHMLRAEDQLTSDYQIAIKTGKTITLEPIINSNPALSFKFFSALAQSIGIHIGRWISFKHYPRTVTAEYLSFFDEMKVKLCQICVIRYLLYSWMLDKSNPSISLQIQQLMGGDWIIKDYLWEAARKHLSGIKYCKPLTMPACFCRTF